MLSFLVVYLVQLLIMRVAIFMVFVCFRLCAGGAMQQITETASQSLALDMRVLILEQQIKQHERDIESLRALSQQTNDKLDELLEQGIKTKWFILGFFCFWLALDKGLLAALKELVL